MATPITWRNVNAPDLGTASTILSRGASAISSGISGLQGQVEGAIKQREEDTVAGLRNTLLQASSVADLEGFDEQVAQSGLKGKKATDLLSMLKDTKAGLEDEAEEDLQASLALSLARAETPEEVAALQKEAEGLSALSQVDFLKDAKTRSNTIRTDKAINLIDSLTDFSEARSNMDAIRQGVADYAHFAGIEVDSVTGLPKDMSEMANVRLFNENAGNPLPVNLGNTPEASNAAFNDFLKKSKLPVETKNELRNLFDSQLQAHNAQSLHTQRQEKLALQDARIEQDRLDREFAAFKEANPITPPKHSDEWNKQRANTLQVAQDLIDEGRWFEFGLGTSGIGGTDISGGTANAYIGRKMETEWALLDNGDIVDITEGTEATGGRPIQKRVSASPTMVEAALRAALSNGEINRKKFDTALKDIIRQDLDGERANTLARIAKQKERNNQLVEELQKRVNNPQLTGVGEFDAFRRALNLSNR